MRHRFRAWLRSFPIIILAVLFFTGISWFIYRALPIRHVVIAGEFLHLSPEQLRTVVNSTLAQRIFWISDMGKIRDVVLQEPWVQGVIVRRVWPNTLEVSVVEAVPIAYWKGEGVLNQQGEVFPQVMKNMLSDIVILESDLQDSSYIANQIGLLKQSVDSQWRHLTRVKIDSIGSVRFWTDDGLEVVLGRRHLEKRLDQFNEILTNTLLGDLSTVATVDLRYTSGFSVRFRK